MDVRGVLSSWEIFAIKADFVLFNLSRLSFFCKFPCSCDYLIPKDYDIPSIDLAMSIKDLINIFEFVLVFNTADVGVAVCRKGAHKSSDFAYRCYHHMCLFETTAYKAHAIVPMPPSIIFCQNFRLH